MVSTHTRRVEAWQGSHGQGWPLRLTEDPEEKRRTKQARSQGEGGEEGLSPTSHILSLFIFFLQT